MKPERIVKPAFAVIGKEVSAKDGKGFVQRLWKDLNANLRELMSRARFYRPLNRHKLYVFPQKNFDRPCKQTFLPDFCQKAGIRG